MQGADRQLEEFLLDSGLLSRGQLAAAARRAEEHAVPLSQALIESGVLGEEEVRRAAAHAFGVPYVTLAREDIDPAALFLIPEPLSRAHGIAAYRAGEGSVEVALLDIAALDLLDFLRARMRVLPRLVPRESVTRALLIYQKHLKDRYDIRLAGSVEGKDALEALLSHAVAQGASALHFEPAPAGPAGGPDASVGAGFRVRYRIGGALHEAMTLSRTTGEHLAAHLRTLAGEARVRLARPEPLLLTVASMPTVEGEKFVLHLVPAREGRKGFTLEALGFHGEGLETLNHALHQKTGSIAIVGPEGNGITTTLYTLLDLVHRPGRAVATVEREVEHYLPGISQTVAGGGAELSAREAVRGALRQDPDVLALHDIEESAALELALQADRRCLVVVGSSEEALQREPTVVVRQRLLRRLCPHCKEAHKLSRAEARMFEEAADPARVLAALKEEGVVAKKTTWKDVEFFRTEGCGACQNGYAGQVGVQEVWTAAAQDASLNLLEEALFKAAEGLTSIEEIVRALGEPPKEE